MTAILLSEKAESYLRKLCAEIPSRRVGSSGNREATDFFAGYYRGNVAYSLYDCPSDIARSIHDVFWSKATPGPRGITGCS